MDFVKFLQLQFTEEMMMRSPLIFFKVRVKDKIEYMWVQ